MSGTRDTDWVDPGRRYEKRRTKILSQYVPAGQVEQLQRQLRLHSVSEDPVSPGSDGSRTEGGYGDRPTSSIYTGSIYSKRDTIATLSPDNTPGGQVPSFKYDSEQWHPGSSNVYPPSQVDRFQQRELGVRNLSPASARPTTPDPNSRRGTMQYSDFAFNPAALSQYAGTTMTNNAPASPGGASRLS
ncbi:MAG: hypothetical protein INR71_11505, partial [Terriglobus roseus]|nr:hypothetical protein [Terriglobus roseus]